MTLPPATPNQMLREKLVNRKPVPCAICHHFIAPFVGRPVILNNKEGIIEFVHSGCCVHEN